MTGTSLEDVDFVELEVVEEVGDVVEVVDVDEVVVVSEELLVTVEDEIVPVGE